MSSYAAPAGPPPANTLYGARALFSIGGVVVGYATSCSWQNSYSYAPLQVLGNLEVVQHLPMSYTVTLTCNNFRLVGTTLRTLNLWPKLGASAQEHLANLVAIPEMVATVEDVQTTKIVAQFEGLRVESSSVQVAQGNVMAEDITFVCRRCKDESET